MSPFNLITLRAAWRTLLNRFVGIETGGAELNLGAVADGAFLKRDGTTIVGATPSAGTVAAADVTYPAGGGWTSNNVKDAVIEAAQKGVDASFSHGMASPAHAASAVSFTKEGWVSTEAQAAIQEAATKGGETGTNAAAAAIATHEASTPGAHAASAISTTAIAGVVADPNVQAVLAELAARIAVLETP
jgi:hypothetical protein